MKRIRPAPMGRAFRVVKRTAHLTVAVAERPVKPGAAVARPRQRAKAAKATPKQENA
jgi:large subunit ribosomal protein L22